MRFVSFSARSIVSDARHALRRLRKHWIAPTLFVVVGLGLGIWLATFAQEPGYTPLLARVIEDTYKPFGAWFLYSLLLAGWLVCCYVSARFRHRVPYLLYCALVGYVWGRMVLFCVSFGFVGVCSLLVGELCWFALCFFVSLVYFAHLGDVLFCSLRPQFNRGALSFGLRCLVVGAFVLFAVCMLWGLVALCVNLP